MKTWFTCGSPSSSMLIFLWVNNGNPLYEPQLAQREKNAAELPLKSMKNMIRHDTKTPTLSPEPLSNAAVSHSCVHALARAQEALDAFKSKTNMHTTQHSELRISKCLCQLGLQEAEP